VLPVYGLIAWLILQGSGSWLLNQNDRWSDYEAHLVPNQPEAMRTIFDADNRLATLADRTPLENALVLVRPCGFFGSVHCYGTVFLRNSPQFDGNVVWANFVPERNAEIIAAFPGRKVYIATWDGKPTIELYQP
jgi:hypothetical protein